MGLYYCDEDGENAREVRPKHPVAAAIWDDILGRKGLGNEMELIDESVAQGIADKWDAIARAEGEA